jgi:hypothetical protein
LAGLAGAILILALVGGDGVGGDTPLSVRLTSPLGRTGTPGAVRIVARIQPASGATIGPVRFLIDGTLYKTKDDGPPYVVEWVDDNPFERREITVEVEDSAGHAARDTVVLEPFEVSDTTEVFSVVLDAAVRDKTGRFIAGLAPEHFQVTEEDVSQKPQLVSQESVPALFVLLVDSSNSMAHNFDFVRQAAGRLLKYLKPHDTVIVAPFTKTLGAITPDPTSVNDQIKHKQRKVAGSFRRAAQTLGYDRFQNVMAEASSAPGPRLNINGTHLHESD